jgi:GH15 family glucan-1,4-alpha-glucosidase
MNRIGDYALIGDCHSSALVGRDGSIDWACFPRFDSPAVFCRILDARTGGAFALTPDEVRHVRRAYMDDTNVLVTEFTCAGGKLELTDCMPVSPLDPDEPTKVTACHAILRRVRCTDGSVAVRLVLAPRFEYGLFSPRFVLTGERSAEIVGGSDSLDVSASAPLEVNGDALVAHWQLERGEEVWIEAAWSPSHAARSPARGVGELASRLESTIGFWRSWIEQCWYDGDHRGAVRRSALTLKALTFAPTGAVVAASTTSLPEWLGGTRNWDYRYTWIRDATLTLISLFVLGFRDEADQFKTWLERTGAGRPQDLQIMYGICGERSLPERELTYLAGHRGSPPVRVGNGAVKQMQLDAYGQILEAAYLYGRAGGELTPLNWSFLAGLTETVCDRWRMPDHGIWEVRDVPRHFTHSKLNCWVALDRAVRMARWLGVTRDVGRWARERDAIRDYLIDEAAAEGWFPQAVGVEVADASTLLMPAMGLLPTRHPLAQRTIERVRRDLERDGLVYRYRSADGLAGTEGAFFLCSFWLVDCLTHTGELEEAQALLERLLGLANDVGLYSEEIDPESGEALGNFPQAFTHMALVLSCAHLSAAKRGLVPYDGAHDYAELAVERLLAAGRRAEPAVR